MKKTLIWLLLLVNFFAEAQTVVGYRTSSVVIGGQPVQKSFPIYADGSWGPVTVLPSDRPKSRKGGVVKLIYAPEGKKTLNLAQFGLDKYYSPNFKFSIDFRDFSESVIDRKRAGQNLFNYFVLTSDEYNTNSPGVGAVFDYATESGLHASYQGANYFERPLAELEQQYIGSVNVGNKKFWTANIENSSNWHPGNQENGAYPGYPSFYTGTYKQGKFPEDWSTAKNKTITLESTGEQNISLQTLADRGFGPWDTEMKTRRANRNAVMMSIAKQRAGAGGYIMYGSSMYQGKPDKVHSYETGVFYDGNADVSKIGGDANGNITINGRQYTLKGDQYVNETCHLDYYYQFKFDVDQSDYNDIWVNNNPAKQNYQSIWAAIKTRHVVADQVGHWQSNRYRMKNCQGQTVRPTMMMRELVYEDNVAGDVNGQPTIARVPGGLNAGCIDFTDGGTTCDDFPKIWIPPYEMYTYYAVHRFLEGGTAGSGFHLFHAPGLFNFNTFAGYDHVYHSVTALFQARADLQIYERFFDNSIMEEQPEVKPDQAGEWQRYDAIQAYNYSSGTQGPQRPVYLVRYQPVAGGWRVVILGGHNLTHGQERTDLVRMPGGLLNGNQFRIKLRGPAAQVFEFIVSNQDTGQTYEANFNAQIGFEKAGYAGRVSNN